MLPSQKEEQLARFEKLLDMGYRLANDPNPHTGAAIYHKSDKQVVARLYLDVLGMPMVGMSRTGMDSPYQATLRCWSKGQANEPWDFTVFDEGARVSANGDHAHIRGIAHGERHAVEFEACGDGYFTTKTRAYPKVNP